MTTTEQMLTWAEAELDPELTEYVYTDPLFGACLKHPLVFSVPLSLPGQANEALAYKTRALDEAIAAEDWHTVVYLHERPYRLEALVDYVIGWDMDENIIPLVDCSPAIRELAASVWTDSENIEQMIEVWTALLADDTGAWLLGDADERAAFDALPDPIQVWRGDIDDGGWSFTTDKKVAEFFANRFPHRGTYEVVSDSVPKSRVFGYLTRRNESEVLVRR